MANKEEVRVATVLLSNSLLLTYTYNTVQIRVVSYRIVHDNTDFFGNLAFHGIGGICGDVMYVRIDVGA